MNKSIGSQIRLFASKVQHQKEDIKYEMCKYANTQIHKYTNTQMCMNKSIRSQIRLFASGAPVGGYQIQNTQIPKYTNAKIHTYA